jgi:hypothetical protein
MHYPFPVLVQALESALRHPADNRTQIRELGQTLIDGGILDDIISERLEAFNSRYEDLSHLVSMRVRTSVVGCVGCRADPGSIVILVNIKSVGR